MDVAATTTERKATVRRAKLSPGVAIADGRRGAS
jgi:hypothetical protein